VRSTAAPYTESRLTRSVANERVGFPVVEQSVCFFWPPGSIIICTDPDPSWILPSTSKKSKKNLNFCYFLLGFYFNL
jgi:hypothetical protein